MRKKIMKNRLNEDHQVSEIYPMVEYSKNLGDRRVFKGCF